jgi:hypothetical protein
LAERRPATRYYELHPGVTTTRLAQEEIVRSLEAQNVRSVVLFDGFDDRREPNESSASSGIAVLDEYLRTRFREVRRYGHHAIWGADTALGALRIRHGHGRYPRSPPAPLLPEFSLGSVRGPTRRGLRLFNLAPRFFGGATAAKTPQVPARATVRGTGTCRERRS